MLWISYMHHHSIGIRALPLAGSDPSSEMGTICRKKSDIRQGKSVGALFPWLSLNLHPASMRRGNRMGEMCKSAQWNCELNSSEKTMWNLGRESGGSTELYLVQLCGLGQTFLPAVSHKTEVVVEHTQWSRQDYSSSQSHSWEIFHVLTDCGGDDVPKGAETWPLMGHGPNLSLSTDTLSQSRHLLTVHPAPGFRSWTPHLETQS